MRSSINDERGLPVRAFISIEKAIKPAVELRTEFHPAESCPYAMDINAA
jgi:hypothetical protein